VQFRSIATKILDENFQCEVCAIDAIINDITYEFQMHWYILAFISEAGARRMPVMSCLVLGSP